MLAKLWDPASLNGHLVCFTIPELRAFHVIILIADTEDVEGRVAGAILVLSADLGLDVVISCSDPNIFVSDGL